MSTFVFPQTPIDTTGLATEAKQDLMIAELQDINAELDDQSIELDTLNADVAKEAKQDLQIVEAELTNTKLDSLIDISQLDVVDQIDSTPLLDVSSTNIPRSSSLPVQVVASTADIVLGVQSVEDIGEFIGLYVGAASSETLVCVLPLGGGDVAVEISAGSRISLRHMKDTDIVSDFISINFLG